MTPCKKFGHTSGRNRKGDCLECAKLRKQTPEYKAAARRSEQRRDVKKRRAAAALRYARDPRATMLQHAKRRAVQARLPFDLVVADIRIPAVCPALGIPLAKGVRRSHDNSPSLDRLRPALGYVRGNVAVISQRANQIKNSSTPDEMLQVAAWLEAQT